MLPDDAELLEGKHFIGIGSYKPNMREYPESIYKLLEKIYIDVDFAKEESGDLATPCEKGWFKEENIQTLYSAVKANSIDRSRTTFCKVGEYDAVITEVSGTAHITGFNNIVLDPDDPLPEGFRIIGS